MTSKATKRKPKINVIKYSRLETITLKNCLRLNDDSYLLFKNKSYSSALMLSILSLEEFGKSLLIGEIIFQNNINGLDAALLNSINKLLHYDHRFKQRYHLRLRDPFRRGVSALWNKDMESVKQSATHVGFSRKSPRGKIVSPFNVSKKKAMGQIYYLNSFLINIAELKIKQGGFFEGSHADTLLNRKLLSKLRRIRLAVANFKGKKFK